MKVEQALETMMVMLAHEQNLTNKQYRSVQLVLYKAFNLGKKQ